MSDQSTNHNTSSSVPMITRFASPKAVLAAGVALVVGCILIPRDIIPEGLLPFINTLAFIVNVYAVSIPGRLDDFSRSKSNKVTQRLPSPEVSAADVTSTNDNNDTIQEDPTETTPLKARNGSSDNYGDDEENQQKKDQDTTTVIVSEDPDWLRARTLLVPAGWAFAIWGIIYLGEATFCAISILSPFLQNLSMVSSSKYLAWIVDVPSVLPETTIPFVIANLTQSLWSVSFRPSYNVGWYKYISCVMLGCTAFALSYVPVPSTSSEEISATWLLLPMILHYGWTTAATLVNLNGSIAMDINVSDTTVAVVGHASSVLATLIGVIVAVFDESPAYGLTVSWALTGCAVGINARMVPESAGSETSAVASSTKPTSTTPPATSRGGKKDSKDKGKRSVVDLMEDDGDILLMAANIQLLLCWTGSVLCAAAAMSDVILPWFL